MKKIFSASIFFLVLALMAAGCTNNSAKIESGSNDFLIKIANKNLNISEDKWKKMQDTDVYAKNFESRTKAANEEFPQVVTVFLNPLSSDRIVGKKISNNEYLEIFKLVGMNDSVVVQIRIDKDAYWVLSRQTFALADSELIGVDPEKSDSAFQLLQLKLQDEIDATRYMLGQEF